MQISNDHQTIVNDQNIQHDKDQEAKIVLDETNDDDTTKSQSEHLANILKNSTK